MPVWLIQLLVGLAINLVVGMFNQSRATPPAPKRPQGFRGTARTGGEVPLSFLLGRCASDGYLEYGREWGEIGKTPNALTVDVLSFSDLPGANLVGEIIDGEEVTLTVSGGLSRGSPIPEMAKGGKDYAWWQWNEGDQTSVNAYLSDKFGSLSKLPWQSDMILRGVGFGVFTARYNKKIFSGFPKYRGIFDGVPLYDIRKDDTAGGTGSQRWNDQSTWTTSDNSAVIIYNIMRGLYYSGEHVWGGRAEAGQFDYAMWSAAMDKCDDLVSLKAGGSEKRYRAGGEIFVNEKPVDVVNRFGLTCNARLAKVGDQHLIQIGIPATDAASITDANIIVSDTQAGVPFPAIEDSPNTVTASFSDPNSGWEVVEAPVRQNATFLADDGGRENTAHLQLDYVFSNTQVQRLQTQALKEGRRFRRHVIVLPPEYGFLRPAVDRISWTSSREGYTDKKFVVLAADEAPNGLVLVALQEVDPSDYDWTPASDEQDYEAVDLTIGQPPAQPVNAFSAVASSIDDGAGTPRRLSIKLGWEADPASAADLDDVNGFWVKAVHKSSGEVHLNQALPNWQDGAANVPSPAFIANETYEVSGVYLTNSGRDMTWAGPIDVTMKDIRLSTADFDDHMQEVTGIVDGTGTNSLVAAIDNLVERQNQLAGSLTGEMALSYSVQGDLAALVAQEADARITADAAQATLTNEVAVQVNEVSASGLIQMQALAPADTPADASVRIAILARKSLADDLVRVGAVYDILPDNTARTVNYSDETFWTDGTNVSSGMTFINDVLTLAELRFEKLTSIDGGIVIDGRAGQEEILVKLT